MKKINLLSYAQWIWKKIKFVLQHVDGLWSVPVSFIIFWFVGVVLQTVYGFGTGIYDPSFLQPIFLAGTIVICATNFAVGGLYFTFRGLYRYIYGQKTKEGIGRINYSKKDWTKLKEPMRYAIAFTVFLYYITAILGVFITCLI